MQLKNVTDAARCAASQRQVSAQEQVAYGYTNDGVNFTGYQNRMQASGSCIDGPEDGLLTSCVWDPRIHGSFYYNSGFSIVLSKAPAFVADVMRTRDLDPDKFCTGVDGRVGLVFRYVKASSAYLGKAEDSIDLDIVFYRSHVRRPACVRRRGG